MSLIDLANILRQQLPAEGLGNITLNENYLNSAGGTNTAEVVKLLKDHLSLPESSIEIDGLSRSDIIDPIDGAPLIISKGEVAFLNVKMTVGTLQFNLANTTLSLTIQTKNFPKDWTLGTSFEGLLVFPMFNGHLENSSYIFSSDDKEKWPVTNTLNENIITGLNFYAELQMNVIQSLDLMIEFLSFLGISNPNNFYLFGQIDVTKPIKGYSLEFPTLDLRSSIFGDPNSTYTIFSFLKVKTPCLGVNIAELKIEDPSDPDLNYQDATPNFYFKLPIILNDIELDFSATLINKARSLTFGVTGAKETALTPGTLFQLMAGSDWLQQVPPPLLAVLSSIKFYGFSMTVILTEGSKEGVSATFTVSSITTSIGSNKPIQLFDPFKELEFWVNWKILNPTSKDNRMSLLSFQAQMQMDDIGTFNIEISETP